MNPSGTIQKVIMEESLLDYGTVDEAYNLLQNGILVETNKGLVCMSLNDALSSDLNLSEEDLKDVATKLILQQNVPLKPKEKVYLKTANLNFDSDGFSSECSDISVTSASSSQSAFITLTPLTGDVKSATLKIDGNKVDTKVVSFLPCTIDLKNLPPDLSLHKSEVDSDINDPTNKFKGSAVSETPAEAQNGDFKLLATPEAHKPPKRRGGWPKGRKRKPELLNLPPKAPATGYNLYLNEQRKSFKDSSLVFHEITKIIGNKWSNLSLEEKRPYLAKAEEDKRRYREELKQYRQSDAYRAYLAKKRKNRLQNNVLSESDMDATDEIDDEDNEELYCRTCDQWFHNLHNKREHLQGRQHTQTIAGEIKRELDTDLISSNSLSTSLDESSLDATPNSSQTSASSSANSVSDCIVNLVTTVTRRETEIKMLERRLQDAALTQNSLCQQFITLRQRQGKLKSALQSLREQERDMECRVSNLWQVPSWFIITDFNADASGDFQSPTE